MDKLRVKLKKILNKDVTNLLNKYKILLVSIAIVVILACVGLIVSYAFYQVVDTTPVILSTTPKIPDLDVRIMAEDRDTNGNGVNSYSVYPYIPKAGYKYEASMSYCTNGGTINYNASTYDASINATGHDVCYLYFKSTASLDITLEVYAENVNSDGVGNGVYTKLETTSLPSIGYEFNSSKSYCVYADDLNTHVTDSTVTFDTNKQNFTVNASKKGAICKAYMDAMDVDIALKIYVQSKKGSSTYFEVDKIPTNNFYEIGAKSACTGTSTMSMKNQKIIIAATNRTNCVAYLNVGSGPILESMQNSVSGQNVTITLTNSNIGVTPTTYYYSKDNGATYVTSTSNSYTFTNLTPLTEFTFKAYSVDASGNTSGILTTTATTDYVLDKPFDYQNSAQQFNVIVSGYYKMRVWGAQGGYRTTEGNSGRGGYAEGTIYLNAGDVLYIHTGGAGGNGSSGCGSTICAGGYNGGGYRYKYYGGGGGTDIRINTDSLLARVIVAGGGGSDGATGKKGMYGGGTTGGSSTESYSAVGNYGGKGGTQTYSGYSASYTITTQTTTGLNSNTLANYAGGFGFGGGGVYLSSGYGGAGGGGWYGGSGNVPDGSGDDDRGGGGGSGYIYTSSTASNYPSGCLLNSSYYLTNASMKAGNESITSPTGATETGHDGNGYAYLTYLGKDLS